MFTIITIRRLPECATREEADRLAAFTVAGEPPGTITARVVEGEPVILAGLVKGGECATAEDFVEHDDPAVVLYLDTAVRVATEHTDLGTIALPITWYTYPEAT